MNDNHVLADWRAKAVALYPIKKSVKRENARPPRLWCRGDRITSSQPIFILKLYVNFPVRFSRFLRGVHHPGQPSRLSAVFGHVFLGDHDHNTVRFNTVHYLRMRYTRFLVKQKSITRPLIMESKYGVGPSSKVEKRKQDIYF